MFILAFIKSSLLVSNPLLENSCKTASLVLIRLQADFRVKVFRNNKMYQVGIKNTQTLKKKIISQNQTSKYKYALTLTTHNKSYPGQ